jgi:hypothetical protein
VAAESVSPAFDAVCAADHPAPDAGGPCATCAFRPGTEANRSEYTTALARACVEGIEPFHCHEHPRACRGWIAAVNLNGAPEGEEWERWREVNRIAADLIGRCIDAAKAEQDAPEATHGR